MTFSIVAYDTARGVAGVAAATGGLAVGAFVTYARAGAGAIATQGASTNWLYGERGLEQLAAGVPAPEALQAVTGDDTGREYRQCVMVDRDGTPAAWTGNVCEGVRGSRTGDAVAVAGNRLVDVAVIDAMLEAFTARAGRPLAERLLSALEAGDGVGGDVHGTVSVAMRVDAFDRPPVDIRVDYAPGAAMAAMRSLYQRYRSAPFRSFYDTVPTRQDYGRCRG